MENIESLKLSNQLCFPLYAASREVIKRYRPFLDGIGLTYTQYIAMMVFWETGKINVKDLGARLFLDSGTLTPVLKSLESKGFIRRRRSPDDERVVIAEITALGEELQKKAKTVPECMAGCISLSPEEAAALYGLLYKLLSSFKETE